MFNLFSATIKHLLWLLTDKGESITIEHAPCPGGHHTSYNLLRASGENFFVAFPERNFQLTLPRWQLETREKMADEGFYLHISSKS